MRPPSSAASSALCAPGSGSRNPYPQRRHPGRVVGLAAVMVAVVRRGEGNARVDVGLLKLLHIGSGRLGVISRNHRELLSAKRQTRMNRSLGVAPKVAFKGTVRRLRRPWTPVGAAWRLVPGPGVAMVIGRSGHGEISRISNGSPMSIRNH